MRKVGVIGLGHVGSTVAYTLVTKGIADELVLIDSNEAKCTAEFYDLLDSLGRLDTYTKLSMNDYQAPRCGCCHYIFRRHQGPGRRRKSLPGILFQLPAG